MLAQRLRTGSFARKAPTRQLSTAVSHSIRMSNGESCPILGFGTWRAPAEVVTEATTTAICSGFRHIDCAKVYRNETAVGAGLRAGMDRGGLQRSDLFVTSKLWMTDFHPKHVEKAVSMSLDKLGLDYLDLYLMHWPTAFQHTGFAEDHTADFWPVHENGSPKLADVALWETWAAMERIVKKGLVRSIGISNFEKVEIDQIMEHCVIAPVVNQVELHPQLQQRALKEECRRHGIVLQAYSPLAVLPEFDSIKPAFEQPEVKRLAAQVGVSAPELLLRWNMQHGNIVITKSQNMTRIAAAAALVCGGLPDDVMNALDAWGDANAARGLNPTQLIDGQTPWWA